MQVNLAKTAGFCFGVDRAVNLVYDLLQKGEKVCTLGPIIHNQQLVDDLKSKGVKIIDDVCDCPKGYTVVIRTHGVEKEVIDKAEDSNINFINATCPFVLKIHKIVSEQPDGTVTLIAGDENHPEVLGIRSYCKGESFVFKNEDELQIILENLQNSAEKSVICVSQTTFSLLLPLHHRRLRGMKAWLQVPSPQNPNDATPNPTPNQSHPHQSRQVSWVLL